MADPRTIKETAAAIRDGQLSPVEVLDGCLERIRLYESQVKAWVLVDEGGARRAAERLDADSRAGISRGPLHGIPLGIKDLFDCQGWPTLAGTTLRAGHRADRDAPVVARLRQAGAIILGKTVTTEFASFDPSITRNPWNLDHTPGGSSSGAAAAVAAGMCLGAIGSQTGGSITRPASFCGVAGCKPTFGRVPLTGVVPLTQHMDHPGPIACCVADLKILLDAIADPNPAEARKAPAGAQRPATAEGAIVLGLPTSLMEEASPAVQRATQTALDALRGGGCRIVPCELPASYADVHRHHRRIMAVEAAEWHAALYSQHRSRFGRQIATLLEEGIAAKATDYALSLKNRRIFRQELAELLRGFDALVTPATVTTAPATLASTGDPRFNSPWSFAGVPTVSFPCGLASDGLPVSLQLVGAAWTEQALLAAAERCESIVAFDSQPALTVRAGH